MAGKFINTTTAYNQVISQGSEVMKGLLDNPYYLFTDKKASECTYYNINTTMSTLDEATRGNYSEISNHSPVRFNKIKGFLLYGITRIEPNLDIGEFGLESSEITGEAIVLPKTIIPYPGDYFYLTSIKKPYLFRVTAVNPNTLETGATLYRINYQLFASDGLKKIEPQVVKTFVFSLNTGGIGSDNGTNLSTGVIEENALKDAAALQDYANMLKDYFISLFYKPNVQTFIYNYINFSKEWYQNNGKIEHVHVSNMQEIPHTEFGLKVYDPYLIEFIIRNKILANASNYLYIGQQMFLPSTFELDYSRTFFSALEDRNINKHLCRTVGNLLLCTQKLSLLYAFPEDYYYMQYEQLNAQRFFISIFDDPEFKNRVKNKEYGKHPFKIALIKHFNNEDITSTDLKRLEHLDYKNSKEFYYGIPLTIYCIEQQASKNIKNATVVTE